MSKTPWFSARKQPPVHDGEYELRCNGHAGWRKPTMWTRDQILWCACSRCEWRGLTESAKRRVLAKEAEARRCR